jgi:hypothetical protein
VALQGALEEAQLITWPTPKKVQMQGLLWKHVPKPHLAQRTALLILLMPRLVCDVPTLFAH